MKTLYYGGEIITMQGQGHTAEVVLVEDDKIIYVGEEKGVKDLLDEATCYKNLEGRTLMPAFIDPHGHFSMMLQMSHFANLSSCKSFKEIKETLNEYKVAQGLSKDDVIVGFGYDHNFLQEEKHPDKSLLDEVSEEIPVFILHTSAHMGVGNSKLLELCHIDEETPEPKGGKYGRVANTLEPNGYAEEMGAMGPLHQVAFSRVKFDPVRQIKKVQQSYFERGITTAQDGAATASSMAVLAACDQDELLKLDVVAYIMVGESLETVMEMYKDYDRKYGNHLKMGGIKMLLDGSPQGKSAWLTKPYEGEEAYCGYPMMTDEEVTSGIKKAMDYNYQVLAHCNGDAASDQFIKGYKVALNQSQNPEKESLRPVMIHCQTVRDDQLDEMATLNMIPSIFVAHTYYWGDVHLKNLGEKRGNHISPARSAKERGLVFNFHQDPPVVVPDMLHTLWCATNRLTKKGRVIGEEEKIDVYAALEAVTIHAAYAYFEEAQKGSLEVGKLSDMVILSENPLKVDALAIKDIQVMETIKSGEVVYVCN